MKEGNQANMSTKSWRTSVPVPKKKTLGNRNRNSIPKNHFENMSRNMCAWKVFWWTGIRTKFLKRSLGNRNRNLCTWKVFWGTGIGTKFSLCFFGEHFGEYTGTFGEHEMRTMNFCSIFEVGSSQMWQHY